jgi:hypothetical protein
MRAGSASDDTVHATSQTLCLRRRPLQPNEVKRVPGPKEKSPDLSGALIPAILK